MDGDGAQGHTLHKLLVACMLGEEKSVSPVVLLLLNCPCFSNPPPHSREHLSQIKSVDPKGEKRHESRREFGKRMAE